MTDNGARVVINAAGTWTNRHRNFSQPYERLYDVWNPAADDFFDQTAGTVTALQQIIAEAIRDNVTVRAHGARWSLSEAAVTDGRLINTSPLNLVHVLTKEEHVAGAESQHLVYMQCGVSVAEANRVLARHEPALALKTSGASNGQTMVGAISTGTHGSAYRFGSMQDFVTGLHIVKGPESSVFLQRASEPAVTEGFARKLGADLIANDEWFDAALVSFGSFGVVVGVVITTEPQYLLQSWRYRVPIDDSLRKALNDLSLERILRFLPGEEPHHFEVVVNPHDIKGGAYVTTTYKRPYDPDYPRPGGPWQERGPGDDLLVLVGKLDDVAPRLVAGLVNRVVAQQYVTYEKLTGVRDEIFSTSTDIQKGMSCEIGLPLERTAEALDICTRSKRVAAYAGLVAFRFVKGSRALLAFTKFPVTCTLELPAAFARRTHEYHADVWETLARQGIPYTLHWGQLHNFTPEIVRKMYGPAVDRWIAARESLLSPDVRRAFSSRFLRATGLG